MRSANLWYEMVMLIIMLLTGATSLTSVVILVSDPIISYTSEKTALDSFDVEDVNEYPRYGRDLLAFLVNADENTPYPNAIKIDSSPVLLVDNNFHTQKFSIISSVYYDGGPYKLSLKLDKEIKEVRFEVINEIDVMHYYIEDTPPIQ